MKIGVEASVLIRKEKTGVDYYTQNLLEQVTRQMPKDTFYLSYISFITKPSAKLGIEAPNVVSRKIGLFPGRLYHILLRKMIGIPYDFISGINPDIFFFPNFVRWPLLWTKKSVIVVYDLSFLHAGEHSAKRNREYLTKFVPRSIKKATQVVVISENTKQEIIDQYGTDSAKITIIYPAVDHSFFKPQTANKIRTVLKKYGISEKYILYTGTIEPRKNIVGLLKAYAQLPPNIKSDYPLVLAGGKGWLDDEINNVYDELRQNNTIIRTGYVPYEDLPILYSGASVFVYPSHYEGFGMPPLEAMACGAPVICSNNSSLPEVVGDAGIMIDANDSVSLAASIEKVLTQPMLASGMSAKGLEQAQKFTWEESGGRLAEVFKACQGED